MPSPDQLLHFDALSLVMMGLVGFVALCVASFSSRYLRGDRMCVPFYVNLTAMVVSVFLMVSADNIFLLVGSWLAGNVLLVCLMLHKVEWEAARQSSILALCNFALGSIFLGGAACIFYIASRETSIQAIHQVEMKTPWMFAASILILLVAMTQSSLWPFHRWLMSSLNSPTPVSAIMHAGLVNGAGFLLARFAPVLVKLPAVLDAIFVVGVVSAILGTAWKLMQSDIKRMLACSTMGQMGFMVAQCGLGLFPAAVAHLCWHGLFKAYLFLASGSAAQEKRLDLGYPPSPKHLFISLLCGIWGAYLFSLCSDKEVFAGDTTLFLNVLAVVAGTQFALPIVRGVFPLKLPVALAGTTLFGALYGASVYLIEATLESTGIFHPQPLNMLHVIALTVLIAAWLAAVVVRKFPHWMQSIYVQMLNASQPHPKTVTAHRNGYQF